MVSLISIPLALYNCATENDHTLDDELLTTKNK